MKRVKTSISGRRQYKVVFFKGGCPFFTPIFSNCPNLQKHSICVSSRNFYPILTLIGYFFQDLDELIIFEKMCKI